MHHNAADAASALVSSSSPSTLAFIDRTLSSVQGRASERASSGRWMDANAIGVEKTAKQQHSARAITIS